MRGVVLRRIRRAISGRWELSAVTGLVRYAAARALEGGNLAEARRLCEKLLDVNLDCAAVAGSVGPGVSLALPCFAGWRCRYATFVLGLTLVARMDLVSDISCPKFNLGIDIGFLNDCLRFWTRIYVVSRCGLAQRRGTTFGHTWDISNTEVLGTSTISHWGPPHEMEMPTS